MTKRPINILVLGKEGVGKTGKPQVILIDPGVHGRFLPEYAHIDEITYERSVTVDDRCVTIRLTDVGGKTLETKTSSKEQLQKFDGAIVVYSIADFKSFHIAEEVVKFMRRERKMVNNMPIIMLGNKHDLEHSREVPRHIGSDAEWSKDGYMVAECSASMDADEVTNIFHKMIRRIIEKREGSRSPRKLSATTIGSPKMIRAHLKRRFSMFTRERTSTM